MTLPSATPVVGIDTTPRLTWSEITTAAEPWDPPPRRTVVIAPHPDDEALGTGGLIAVQRRRGVEVVVIAVTDGDAAPHDHVDDLAALRRREQERSLTTMGVPTTSIHRCAIPDGRVSEHTARLRRALDDIVRPGDLVVGPSILDHHSDHVACGEVVGGYGRTRGVTTFGWLFWAYHRTDPVAATSATFRRLDVDAGVVRRRSAGVAVHRSQFAAGSVLTGELVAHLDAPFELFEEVSP